MSQATAILTGLSLIGGLCFTAVAALGVLRLPDLYCRAHALGKAMTLGMVCFLLALGFSVPEASWFKIIVAIAFQFVTIPVASHLLCLAAYRRRVPRWTATGWSTESEGRTPPLP
jgi:multicomponent Na+:H+ antiporter subunit G